MLYQIKLSYECPPKSLFHINITFLTAARQATNTPSLATLADSHLQSSTSRFNPWS